MHFLYSYASHTTLNSEEIGQDLVQTDVGVSYKNKTNGHRGITPFVLAATRMGKVYKQRMREVKGNNLFLKAAIYELEYYMYICSNAVG